MHNLHVEKLVGHAQRLQRRELGARRVEHVVGHRRAAEGLQIGTQHVDVALAGAREAGRELCTHRAFAARELSLIHI